MVVMVFCNQKLVKMFYEIEELQNITVDSNRSSAIIFTGFRLGPTRNDLSKKKRSKN